LALDMRTRELLLAVPGVVRDDLDSRPPPEGAGVERAAPELPVAPPPAVADELDDGLLLLALVAAPVAACVVVVEEDDLVLDRSNKPFLDVP
jgi:hypothetical protein